MNIGDILIGGILAAALLLALFAMSKNNDKGCSGNCSSCSGSDHCQLQNKNNKTN